MVGLLIKIEGTTTNRTISAVDVDKQKITLTADADTAGNDLMYSIQDNYSVDPAGIYKLILTNASEVDDDVIAVNYRAWQTELTGDQDKPLIPAQFHHVIVLGATVEWLSVDGEDAQTVNRLESKFERAVRAMLINEDVMGEATDDAIEPDVVRHKRTANAR
jgi:hypothetical protein